MAHRVCVWPGPQKVNELLRLLERWTSWTVWTFPHTTKTFEESSDLSFCCVRCELGGVLWELPIESICDLRVRLLCLIKENLERCSKPAWRLTTAQSCRVVQSLTGWMSLCCFFSVHTAHSYTCNLQNFPANYIRTIDCIAKLDNLLQVYIWNHPCGNHEICLSFGQGSWRDVSIIESCDLALKWAHVWLAVMTGHLFRRRSSFKLYIKRNINIRISKCYGLSKISVRPTSWNPTMWQEPSIVTILLIYAM